MHHHRRFAVRRHVTLSERGPESRLGLLFELWAGGCRVSDLGGHGFAFGEPVKVHIPGFGDLEGRIRCTGEGVIALRYAQPLRPSVLERLLRICRGSEDAALAVG